MAKFGTQTKSRSGLIVALDVGTTKICCLIAKPVSERSIYGATGPSIIGIGHQGSAGIKSGSVVDLQKLEASVRATVEAAEQMAGENIAKVFVNISCGKPVSRIITRNVEIAGHEIGEADLNRVHDPVHLLKDQPEDHTLLHKITVGYNIDGNRGVREPVGMFGENLGVNIHLLSALNGPLRNLETGIRRCHLDIEKMVLTPFASALSCLSDEEKRVGMTCIDIGGGTTTYSMFFDGDMIHAGVIPYGGENITRDISHVLSMPFENAERLKNLKGSAVPSINDDHETINYHQIGEEPGAEESQVKRSMLVGIIKYRVEEIMELVNEQIEASGFSQSVGRRVVLTGGTSQLTGITEVAARILNKDVSLGRPMPVEGLAEAVAGPGFSTCVGLLQYATEEFKGAEIPVHQTTSDSLGLLARIGHWFRNNI